MKPREVTMDALDELAFDNHLLIEFDYANNIAVLKVGAVTYYAKFADRVADRNAADGGAA